jgi:hypothetical protein
VEAHHRALIALHALSPDYRVDREKLPEPYRGRRIDEDLRLVTEAPIDEVPVSARLAVLYDLAKADYPGRPAEPGAYQELASSAVRFRVRSEEGERIAGEDLLEEIKAAADARVPLSSRPRVAPDIFVHHEVAFIGRDVCSIQRVQVGGIRAAWIYSEFETDAQFGTIADWIDPHRWPKLGPLLFKRMTLVDPDPPEQLRPPPAGDPHWHAVFLEEVQLVERLRTFLRCSYWRSDATAATTYDLAGSIDDQIDVDRGYVLVTDVDGRRRVQVLKIVSFTQDLWDFVALFVCPFWTDWIRQAVEGGGSSSVLPPSMTPDLGSPLGRSIEAWIDYFGDAVQPYLDLCADTSNRLTSRSSVSSVSTDMVTEGARWWSQFAKDWARAWTNWAETVEEVAEHGLDAGVTPPGVPREVGRGSVRALVGTAEGAGAAPAGGFAAAAGLAADERVTVSELVSIDRGAATIPPDQITLTVEQGGRVRLRTTGSAAPVGLYVGQLRNAANRDLAPALLYVSKATKA